MWTPCKYMLGLVLLLTALRGTQARAESLQQLPPHHLSHDPHMPTRAMEELANVCHFVDWNPGYYLDERERSLAEAFGYDWLHDDPKVRHFASPPAPAGRPAQ